MVKRGISLKNTHGFSEQLCNIFHTAGKGTADMSALFRKGFRRVIWGAVIFIKKYKRFFKNREVVK